MIFRNTYLSIHTSCLYVYLNVNNSLYHAFWYKFLMNISLSCHTCMIYWGNFCLGNIILSFEVGKRRRNVHSVWIYFVAYAAIPLHHQSNHSNHHGFCFSASSINFLRVQQSLVWGMEWFIAIGATFIKMSSNLLHCGACSIYNYKFLLIYLQGTVKLTQFLSLFSSL